MENVRRKRYYGASLLFVVIAVAFVGILATIVTRITVINLNIKSVDRQTKKNFYSAESVMDEVDIAVESLTADAMKTAYVDIMSEYVTTAYSTTDQNSIQVRFAYLYLKELVEKLSNGNSSIASDYTMSHGAIYDVKVIKEKMKDLLEADESSKSVKCWDYVDETISNPNLVLTFDTSSGGERSLTLKNVRVEYYETDSNGEKKSTWLKTDIKVSAPNLSFESGNIYPEFTKYSIIGDNKVSASIFSKNDVVNGSVYAGSEGLSIKGYSGEANSTDGETLTIGGTGTNVITRGDVEVVQGGRLCLGTDESDITVWTENLNTVAGSGSSTGSTAPAKLTVYGNAYVHDDLSLNSPYSLVSYLSGNYFGYTFNRDNSTRAGTYVNSNYSSAIVLNGRHSSLYMGDSMESILLGGQAYISRNYDREAANKKDILLGQSLSVKSDQKFYMVSNDDLADGFKNPMSWEAYQNNIADPTKGTKISGGRTPLVSEKYNQLKNLLDKTEPVTTYVVNMTMTSSSADTAMVYMYYNFRNYECANTYFKNYVKNGDLLDRIVSSEYLKFDGAFNGLDIDMSSNLAIFANSSLLTHVDEEKLETTDGTLDGSSETTLMANSIRYASQYKSYQLTLTDGNWTEYSADADSQGYKAFDLYDDGTVNLKETDTIFEALMSKTEDNSQYSFVYDAANDPTANGYESISGYGDAWIKIVPVNIGGGYVYAIFVAQLDSSSISSGKSVPTDVILSRAAAVGFNASDANNYSVMIVSNGDISVTTDLHGIVISDTEVEINATNRTMTAEPAALQAMFSAQKSVESGGATPATDFLTYFKCFEDLKFGADEDAVDILDISKCISHANWRKNEEE